MSFEHEAAFGEVLRRYEAIKAKLARGSLKSDDVLRLEQELRRLRVSLRTEAASNDSDGKDAETDDSPMNRELLESDAVTRGSDSAKVDFSDREYFDDLLEIQDQSEKTAEKLQQDLGTGTGADKLTLRAQLPPETGVSARAEDDAESVERAESLLTAAFGGESFTDRGPWPFVPLYVLADLFRLSGSEIESQEISFAILLATADRSGELDQFVRRERGDVRLCANVPQRTVGTLHSDFSEETPPRDSGWTERFVENSVHFSGGMFAPVLFLGRETSSTSNRYRLTHCQLVVPEASATNVDNATALYEKLTEEGDASVRTVLYWVKPARAIRVYRAGQLQAQLLRLRKSQERACRNPAELERLLCEELKRRNMLLQITCERLTVVVKRIVAAAVELSETRSGGAIYLTTYEFFCENVPPKPERLVDRLDLATTSELSNPDVLDFPFPVFVNEIAQDGSVIVSVDGRLLGTAAYFRSGGGRRNTGKELCCQGAGVDRPIVGVIISQDGDILVTVANDFRNWGL